MSLVTQFHLKIWSSRECSRAIFEEYSFKLILSNTNTNTANLNMPDNIVLIRQYHMEEGYALAYVSDEDAFLITCPASPVHFKMVTVATLEKWRRRRTQRTQM